MDYRSQLDHARSLAGEYIRSFAFPWQALKGLGDYLFVLGETLGEDYLSFGAGVWVHKSAKIAPTAEIRPPSILCAETQVRQGAYLRGGVLVGKGCVVGNSVELKNCVLFDGAQVPHFNYVGDSILGYRAHMGAGAITSNVRLDNATVCVRGKETIETGLRKFGAIVGDGAQIGCNAVLNPGSVVGRYAVIYPLTSVHGVVEERQTVKRE